MTSFAVTAIGKVESPLTQPESAPRQPDEGAPAAWLVFEPEVLEGLQSIRDSPRVVHLRAVRRSPAPSRRRHKSTRVPRARPVPAAQPHASAGLLRSRGGR